METSFVRVLITVWRQALVENADVMKIGAERYPVTRSKAKRLRQVAFEVDGNTIMGIGQRSGQPTSTPSEIVPVLFLSLDESDSLAILEAANIL